MNILELISGLRTVDIVILIFVIFIFIFLLLLTSTLMKKNKQLRQELNNVNNSMNIHDEPIIKKEIDNTNIVNEESEKINVIDENKEEDINDILENIPEIEETGPYKKNVLRELSARGQTSPVNIGKSTVDVPKVNVTSYAKKEIETTIPETDNKTFVEEISRRMEDELKPQTIELTDYERKQEEEAIISYQELLKAKDRMYKITDDEEIDTFIDELKEFRTNLEE